MVALQVSSIHIVPNGSLWTYQGRVVKVSGKGSLNFTKDQFCLVTREYSFHFNEN